MQVDAAGLARLNHVAGRFSDGDRIIITGGIFDERQGDIAVAAAMQQAAVSIFNLPPGAISTESNSRTTIENVLFVNRRFADSLGRESRPPILVSSRDHILRCWFAWLLLARQVAATSAAPADGRWTPRTCLREMEGLMVTALYSCGLRWPHDLLADRRAYRR